MGALYEGIWQAGEQGRNAADGRFTRAASAFRRRVTADGRDGFRPEPGRYHLYISKACPWAHRTMIFRAILGLDEAITLSGVRPINADEGWTFDPPDAITGANRLYEVYQQADARYTGRVTVPVLWDKHTRTIVNNESAEIIRTLSHDFATLAHRPYDFYPADLAAEIDAINARVYETVNNGVYRAGFAKSQSAYDDAVVALFATLDWLDDLLSRRRYLTGPRITEADWRLFTTMVRFDAVYYGHFKCNIRHVYEYPNLWAHTRELHQWPGVAATVDLPHIKTHYYGSQRSVNPTGIVPFGPVLDFAAPHGRDHLPAA